MSYAIELNRRSMPASAPASAAADRRTRSSRAAYDRILDRAHPTERQKAADALAAAARNQPALAREQGRIQTERNRLARRGELFAVSGALAIIGLVAGLCMTVAPLAAPLSAIVAGALGLAGFRFAMIEGRQLFGLQFLVQLVATFALLGLAAPGAHLGFLAALMAMGWAALGLRAVQMAANRHLDIDEVELMLQAQGRQTPWAVREDMQRRLDAAI